MKSRTDLQVGIVLASLVLLSAGCGSGQAAGPTAAPEPAGTSAPEATSAPTQAPAPSATPAPTATIAPTLTASEQTHLLAETGVTANADWTPYTEEINGVMMALVPAGCFPMGSTDEQIAYTLELCDVGKLDGLTECSPDWFVDEKPQRKVCFDKPFWIDVTEVTNDQFEAFGGQAGREGQTYQDADFPRGWITWTESDAFCQKRGARLPTAAEWEYTARGPDGLVFVWGNTWDSTLSVWNAKDMAVVGSNPGDVSWVGACDMNGNQGEWVNDWFSTIYYATLADGVVNPQGPEEGEWQTPAPPWVPGGVQRSLRGGTWYTENPIWVHLAFRGRTDKEGYHASVGFRCALSYEP